MFQLLFGPEDGGIKLLRNIGKILLAYGVTAVSNSIPAYEAVYSVLFRSTQIPLSTLFSDTLNLCLYLNAKDRRNINTCKRTCYPVVTARRQSTDRVQSSEEKINRR
jgi:hypothetical protein